MVKIQGASGGRTKQRTMHEERLCLHAERKKKSKMGNEKRNERGTQRKRGWEGKVEERWHGSSHHVVYQRHFILIFRERGRGGGKGLEWWRREKA